jgi:hypothetical protein
MKNAEKRIQKKYSEEEKNKIIGRMLPPESATWVGLSRTYFLLQQIRAIILNQALDFIA